MRISDLFLTRVVKAVAGDPLAAIARRMKEHNVGTVVVVDDDRPIGIVTDRDLALALGANGASPQTPVETVMSHRVLAIPDDADILTATKYIREVGVRRLPVVDRNDHVVGMVTLDDLLGLLGRELHDLIEGIKHEMEVK